MNDILEQGKLGSLSMRVCRQTENFEYPEGNSSKLHPAAGGRSVEDSDCAHDQKLSQFAEGKHAFDAQGRPLH